MPQRYIPVARPQLNGNEKAYVMDCLETTWISSNGAYIERFEKAFASLCGVPYAAACTNGTVALRCWRWGSAGRRGDRADSDLRATATVTYCGATPVFVDSEPG
jgi:perosamine synthetase